MSMLTCHAGRHALTARGDDLYETPAVAVRALLYAEMLPRRIWEPCCGPGAIARVLRDAGHEVIATDLVDYDSPDQDRAGLDFLLPCSIEAEAIITNPPFKLAAAMIATAIERAPYVAMLLPLSFWESGDPAKPAGRLRIRVLDEARPARCLVFTNRLPMMHRAGWKGPKASSARAFAWFIWERDHLGLTEMYRIRWEDEAA